MNEFGGTGFEAFERLLEYGELVEGGVPPGAAVGLLLTIIERGSSGEPTGDVAVTGPRARSSFFAHPVHADEEQRARRDR